MPPGLIQKLEELDYSTTPKLALLILLGEAKSIADPGGRSLELDRLAWRGLEILCQDVLRDVEEVLRVSGVQGDGFAMLPDEKGELARGGGR